MRSHSSRPPGYLLLLIQLAVFTRRDQITQLNGSPAAISWIEDMLAEELIKPSRQRSPDAKPYGLTERGQVFLDRLCDTPLPRPQWGYDDDA